MRLTFLMLITFCFVLFSQAQTRDTIYLWPGEVPGESSLKAEPVQSANTTGNVIRLSEVTNPALMVFKPKKPNQSSAGIIVCPGGGYQILALDKEGYEVAEWLNDLGYTAFVLQYRVPKKQLGALNDIQRAIRFVRSNADVYNLNPNKVGVMGFSAGASLCARASTEFTEDSYAKIDAIDEISCRPNFAMLIYPAYLDQGENRSLTPELTINDYTPPFFIFSAADDKFGNSGLVMTTALRDKKVPVELHVLSKGGHGYGLREGNIAAETWPLLAKKWLDQMVKTTRVQQYQRCINFPKTTEYPTKLPKKKDVWVFLMAGQSNMAGRGFVEPQDTIPSQRILSINKSDEVILAKEPLNYNEPTFSGLDCGVSFAKELLKQVPNDVSILLIPTAVGGSTVSQWLGDSIHRDVQLLNNFHDKIELAKRYGTIKGVIWHQGESDANEDCIPEYENRLSQLMKIFRKFAGNKSLPIMLGELGTYSENKTNWLLVNKQIENYVAKDENAEIIFTSDLKQRGDDLHFNSESQRLLGQRFANEYMQSIK